MADYSVLPFSDENGELYLGVNCSASWKWIGAGRVDIHLERRSLQHLTGREVVKGTCNQVDKAPDICRAWIERGAVSPNLTIER